MRLIALTFAAAAVLAVPAAAQAPVASPAQSVDWRMPDPENVLVIDTNKGRIIVEER